MSDELVKKIRSKNTLYQAWRAVRSNGLKSQSEETRKQIREYELDSVGHINSLSARLRNPDNFHFDASRGVPIPRKGKTDRPIVVATTDTKIIQRAVLDVLQSIPKVRAYVETPTSFGGIQERSVEKAITYLVRSIEQGNNWFARSDIHNFFVNINRDIVVGKIGTLIDDIRFRSFFAKSLQTELVNIAELREKRHLFPIEEIGVAQGSSLSPFAGNVLLHDFDIELNTRGIICVRYIDDFILLARNQNNLKKAVSAALGILNDLGLTAYDPSRDSEKGAFGHAPNEKIDFLGVEISGTVIRPSNPARQRLMEKVDEIIARSTKMFCKPDSCYFDKVGLVRTLSRIDDTLQGWVTQYSFCNDTKTINRINSLISERIRGYLGRYSEARASIQSEADKRRILGVRWLEDKDWQGIKKGTSHSDS